MTRTWFLVALLVGAAVRIAALPLPGTRDTIVWRVWSYNAAREGVSRLYGVGGSPPERRVISYLNVDLTVDYPPIALHELGLAGRVYRKLMGGEFPNTTPLMVAIKIPAFLADVGLAVLLYYVSRRWLGVGAARWAATAYWVNPAVVLDAEVLGYLDPQFALPAIGALAAAFAGSSLAAGALTAVAVLTKPQAVIVAPAIALMTWRSTLGERGRLRRLVAAGASALAVAVIVFAPIVRAGGGPNVVQALGRVATHDMLSGNACNLWWIVGYIVRATYSFEDYGVWGAFTHQTQILGISRFMEVGYPNPRVIGGVFTVAAMAWAMWRARRLDDLWLAAALGGFLVHAYFTLSAQVHENHLFAAVPFLVLAAAGRRRLTPVLVVVSAISALNLNLFYGIGEDVGYALPRGFTIIDTTVLLAMANCVALAWHARVFSRECATTGTWGTTMAVAVPGPSLPAGHRT